MGKIIQLELPDPDPPTLPDLSLHPTVAQLMADVAVLKERTEREGVDPAAAEALRLAGEARTAADAVASRVASLEEKSLRAAPVVDVRPPPPVEVPAPDPAAVDLPTNPESLPWYHPKRWF